MSLLPTVNFCGLEVTRLVIGANPFGGFSHQNAERDAAMKGYHSVERIVETWRRAEAAGIDTFITNNETEHVVEAVRRYLGEGGSMQWIAQVAYRKAPSMEEAIDGAVRMGAKALYIHGGVVDDRFAHGDEASIRRWCAHARSAGVPVGVAGHAPEAHRWVNELDAVDFHAVCFFNCGSVHAGQGERFRLADVAEAVSVIRSIAKPCIAYKIMGAGRLDARMAFEHAFEHIKPSDIVNVGMHRGDRDDMVEENVRMVGEVLGAQGGQGV